ncbi:hypothetical protein IMG5_167720 [Ichthyophthirius multifiliis]|uniref:ABC transporter family protein n=1 Tax=Ichthyophthirius multifiliis TaxID=5932 RepID=G0R0Z8_ICHMU|nr:hypothetical protein IMG5_167720 [Ichthyophthirius multifiliis]EGR28863.1 hypothetical protein IMG5_167720 [Ichthyophthirius multifiliis]|eukprot:XP_004030099.1 hypothetical protein IMG5_167720 [Ichthyophthirius multifiliis]
MKKKILFYGLYYYIFQGLYFATKLSGKYIIFINLFNFYLAQIRMSLVQFLYQKNIDLTQNQIKKSNIGKLFGLISNDINYIEVNIFYGFYILYLPIQFIISAIILYYRFNAFGILSIAIIFIILPIQLFLGYKQKKIISLKNIMTDKRLNLINECVQGIRLIKMYGWEQVFSQRIDQIRIQELNLILKYNLYRILDKCASVTLIFLGTFIPVLIIYNQDSEILSSSKIYATLQQLYSTKNMIIFTGYGITFLQQLQVILKRFNDFLNISKQKTQQLKQNQNYKSIEENIIIEFKNFYCFWDKNKMALKNINLKIQKGNIYAFIGKVGSGKSSLLFSILDEVPYIQGTFKKQGSISYVEQEPYIFTGKFKDNILFGEPYDHILYQKVCEICCLGQDIESLPDADQTEIGEKGVTLSGGQKARLSLARAIYKNSDIYLLDDPLSAVDTLVAKKIFQDAILGYLGQKKTVLLVTHQIYFAQECDFVYRLDNGNIFQELDFQKQIQHSLGQQQQQLIAKKQCEQNNDNKETIKKLLTNKKQEKINVNFQTYYQYLKFINNYSLILITFFLYVLNEALYTLFYQFLGSYDQEKDKKYLFYSSGTILIAYSIVSFLKYALSAYLINLGNYSLHKITIEKLINTHTHYFDQTPTGQIINKFSNDIGTMDLMFIQNLIDSLEALIQLLNIVITICIFNPYMLILLIFTLLLLFYIFGYAKQVLVPCKYFDLLSKSPVFSFFQQSMEGIIHIQIYNQKQNFIKKMNILCNNCTRANYAYWRFGRAYTFYVQQFTAFISFIGYIVSIYLIKNSREFGQTIVYLTMITEIVFVFNYTSINFQQVMCSVERLIQLINLESEGEYYKKQENINKQINASWIQRGEVIFDNLFMKYRKDLPNILNGISFNLKPGEKVAFLGRTGAGKSSILQALFRMCPEMSGNIFIDGINTKDLGLHTLRNHIGIIPQNPFVFDGTIRRNIDPLEEFSDEEIWDAIKKTDLQEVVNKLEFGLNSLIQNQLSVGQKQLICLARVIVKKSKLLVLDEATANLDFKTDNFIQQALKIYFKDRTVITIAHRINTIADYDKVFIISDGLVVENDNPFLLLVNNVNDSHISKSSLFANMVKNTGDFNAQEIFTIAKNKYLKTIYK